MYAGVGTLPSTHSLDFDMCVQWRGEAEGSSVCLGWGGGLSAPHCHVASFNPIVLCSLESARKQQSRFIDAQPLIRNACIHLLESILSGSLLPGCHKYTHTHTVRSRHSHASTHKFKHLVLIPVHWGFTNAPVSPGLLSPPLLCLIDGYSRPHAF